MINTQPQRRYQAKTIYSLTTLIIILFILFIPNQSSVEAETPSASNEVPTEIMDLRSDEFSSSPHALTPVGNTLFFIATEDEGTGLFKTTPPYNQLNRISDVTAGGDGITPDEIAVIDGIIFFQAKDAKNGIELWKSEPPYNQASMVADINPVGDSFPKNFLSIGNALFFQANGGNDGAELWKTQPPYTSAVQVSDIFPGGGSSAPYNMVQIGWIIFFAAEDGGGRNVWKSEPPYDQTSTRKILTINPGGDAGVDNLIVVENTLFFNAMDDVMTGQELWKLTAPYTKDELAKVNDLESWGVGRDPSDLYSIGETLFYTGYVFTSGSEVHKVKPDYDTTSTYSVADINPGFFSSSPNQKTSIGSTLFFSANDGDEGYELWKSESPYTDAVEVADINAFGGSDPHNLTPVGTSMYFAANDGAYGTELWKSDPPYIQASTIKVAEINLGSDGSSPAEITAIGSTLFFSANNGKDGVELWKINSNSILPSTGFAPNRMTIIQGAAVPAVKYGSGDLYLEIPSINITVPIMGIPQNIDGWNLDWLWDNAGYLEGTAFPTRRGNSVITAHVVLPNGKPGPFGNLRNLKYDDKLILHAWGEKYIYSVRSILTVNPEDVSVLGSEKLSWLTLITCQGYDEESSTYQYRLAVRAVLTDVGSE